MRGADVVLGMRHGRSDELQRSASDDWDAGRDVYADPYRDVRFHPCQSVFNADRKLNSHIRILARNGRGRFARFRARCI